MVKSKHSAASASSGATPGDLDQLDILAKINSGLDDSDIAAVCKVSEAKIAAIRADLESRGLVKYRAKPGEKPLPKMTHSDRRARRQEIAAYVDSGKTYEDAAAEFKVSPATVLNAVKAYGTTRKEPKETTQAEVFKAAVMFFSGMKDVDVARELDISRERARTMRIVANEAGLEDALAAIVQASMEAGRRQAS